jgi:hypothetical protein
VLPISILLLAVMSIFFGRTVSDPTQLILGMTAAVLGLGSFIDALRVCVMPLSEQVGTELPKTLPLPAVLGVAFFLGVLVTYAEPAISTLRPLAKIVDINEAPYLYCILMVGIPHISTVTVLAQLFTLYLPCLIPHGLLACLLAFTGRHKDHYFLFSKTKYMKPHSPAFHPVQLVACIFSSTENASCLFV